MSVEFKTNFDFEIKKLKRYIRKGHKNAINDAMWASLEYVGNVSARDFMIPTTIKGAVANPSNNAKLSVRSGRLIGSVVGNWRFSSVDLPKTIKRLIGDKIKTSTSGFDGGKKESIRKVKVSGKQFEGIIGSKVPYARIHEEGGVLHPANTSKAKAFFWGMYYETRIEKWKYMALSPKSQFDVSIKARPYLRPAVEKSRDQIIKIFHEAVSGQAKLRSNFFEKD